MSVLKLYPIMDQKVTLIVDVEDVKTYKTNALVHLVTPEGALKLLLVEDFVDELMEVGISVDVEYFKEGNCYRIKSFIEDIKKIRRSSDSDGGKRTPLLVLSPPSYMERIERRKFFRLPIVLPVRFKPVSFPAGFEESASQRRQVMAGWRSELNQELYTGRVADISGGGLLMITDYPLSKEDELFLEIFVSDLPLQVAARVTWFESAKSVNTTIQKVGVQFVGLEESKRERIINFIFQEERRRKANGNKE